MEVLLRSWKALAVQDLAFEIRHDEIFGAHTGIAHGCGREDNAAIRRASRNVPRGSFGQPFAVHGMNRGEDFLACRFPTLSLRVAHWTLAESVDDPKSDEASGSVLGGPFNSTVLPSGSFR